jgi:hypothetical protein
MVVLSAAGLTLTDPFADRLIAGRSTAAVLPPHS